ncbi:MAG: 3-isopropylmalate dehydratase small subunit [Porphyromonadaceae bacterium]|nr:MAG: 3-isopropylmalate dehydratase small subunit [Porphyromonadaceae bacterium]
MSFEPLNTIISKVVLLQADNIDTDRIIPARFLKSVDSSGFGKNLFHDWRYRPDGTPDPDFVLNKTEGQGQILLTGSNFGCGSSREHAAWALYQYGFRVIISSGFADIFRTNALNNGLLPLEVSEQQLARLMEIYQSNPRESWTVDLKAQQLVPPDTGTPIPFDINPFRKHCLLTGSDLIDYLAGLKPQIMEYENNHRTK